MSERKWAFDFCVSYPFFSFFFFSKKQFKLFDKGAQPAQSVALCQELIISHPLDKISLSTAVCDFSIPACWFRLSFEICLTLPIIA